MDKLLPFSGCKRILSFSFASQASSSGVGTPDNPDSTVSMIVLTPSPTGNYVNNN